ncbi:hypothetical protein AN2V17_30220 [Vallitalea sp. AN17-2]|uniref:Uncharacterized protein n=1 Tax=Vallitalea maricola TaxID=3074433 RepID=A0ACB5UMC7_9FIRM|nr:hypothetical protein AN2V17_30220 [Vallitalea sp. AN17-2]
MIHCFLLVCPAWAQSNGLESLTRTSSGKRIANDKGVLGDKKSEGSRRANLWSDEQKSYQAVAMDKAAKQVKFQ